MDPVASKEWQLLEEGLLHDWNTFGEGEESKPSRGTPNGKVWSVLDEVLGVDLAEEWDSLEEWLRDVLHHCSCG